jgi:hypothetical protein
MKTKPLFCLAASALLLAGIWIGIARSPLPWVDEVLWASAAHHYSLARGAVPSVLADYPGTGRFDLFYGPAALGTADLWLKLVSFGITGYRALPFVGATLVCLFGALVVWTCTRNALAAASTSTIVAASQMIGSRATSGRLDTLTVAAELAGLWFLLVDAQSQRRRIVYGACAGALLGYAALSSPRAFPTLLAIGIVALIASVSEPKKRLPLLATAGAMLAAIAAWTHSVGFTPLGWLRFIARASHNDSGNASPLLGGSWGWGTGSAAFALAVYLSALLTVATALLGWNQPGAGNKARFLLRSAFINLLVTLLLLSRPASYDIFWLMLPLLAAIVVTVQAPPGGRRKAQVAALAALSLLWASIRIAKTADMAQGWAARDPAPLAAFMKQHVPAESVVYGPPGLYFYAVEEAGAHYRFTQEWTTAGLESHQAPQRAGVGKKFLLWTEGAPLPEGFASAVPVARFAGAASAGSRAGITDRYPATILYAVEF